MKTILNTLFGFVPDPYRKYIPLILVVLLILLFFFPALFGDLGPELNNYALTSLAPTPTLAP